MFSAPKYRDRSSSSPLYLSQSKYGPVMDVIKKSINPWLEQHELSDHGGKMDRRCSGETMLNVLLILCGVDGEDRNFYYLDKGLGLIYTVGDGI
jgi:hypothetical protein